MTNIKSMEMATVLFSNPNISVSKGFLGMGSKVKYQPTGSVVNGYYKEYKEEIGKQVENLLTAAPEKMRELAKRQTAPFDTAQYGQYRLAVCVSDDKQFIALQLTHYDNLLYHPITSVKMFEGEDAKLMATLF